VLSVYTRHASGCAKAKDKDWRRCRCPKWIWGIHEGKFIRNSAQTRSWEKAEVYRRQLEATSGPTPVQTDETFRVFDRAPAGRLRDQKKARVTIETAVDAYLRDAKSRELESSTLSKLEGIFRKQFLTWCTSEGYKFLDEIDLDALLLFRNTWIDGPLAKRKKQERLIGFFWACVRRGYITENPTFGLGKIKVDQTPTDYFPPHEFDKIVDATYAYRENRGETGNANSTRLRTMTLLMRWSGLRIHDAVTLERSRLHGDSLLLTKQRPGRRSMFLFPLISSRHCEVSQMGQNPTPAIFSGAATVRPRASSPTGREAIVDSLPWLTSPGQTAPPSVVIHTCSATRSLWRCCLQACRLIRFQSC
jgi:hypothetical protein